MRDDFDLGAFIMVMNNAMDHEIAFHNNASSNPACHPPLIQPSAQVLVPTTLPKPSTTSSSSTHNHVDPSHVHCSSLYCNNFKKPGHIDLTCFKEGGGMAGRCDEYLNDKSCMHVMFTECLEGAFSAFSVLDAILDAHIPPDPTASPPPTIDDQIIVPITAMCISATPTNPDLFQDLYYSSDHKFPNLAFSSSVDFTSIALLSITALFNALLNSGCTHHIIKDRSLFSNYVSKAISVGTANCGSLQALGTGDVSFHSPFGEHLVLFSLCGCLHAPDTPINLLSVGSLVERGMSALFTPGGLTTISFPSDHLNLPAFSFSTTVHNHLSFLKLDFVLPVVSPAVLPDLMALPALTFPQLKLDSILWH